MRALMAITATLLALLPQPAARADGPAEDWPKVELLVLGPGDPVFTRYGHVAVRVIHEDGRDLAYNFGLTNFRRPNYVADFLSGRVQFWGRPLPYRNSVARARQVDRSLTRLPLLLGPEQKARLVERLEELTRPEVRHYVYDTFRDNCATRIRDVLDQVTGGALRRATADRPLGPAYRDDVRRAFANLFGLLLATEIVPGVELDRPRTEWELLYHPLRLADAVARARITTDGREHPLAGPAQTVYTRRGPDPLQGWPDGARALLLGLAGLWLLAALTARRHGRRRSGLMLATWALCSGLLGSLLIGVHCWTDWPDMRFNWLMAGFLPLDLWLLGPAWSLLHGRSPGPRGLRLARTWLWIRIGTFLPVVLATGVLGLSPANGSAEALALAGLALAQAVFRADGLAGAAVRR